MATAVSVGAAFYLSSVKEPIGGGYENFLLFIGAVFVPLLGIVLADFWIIRKGKYDISEFYGQTSKVKWRAIAAWIPGITLYYWLSPSLVRLILPSYVGPGFSLGASVPAFLLSATIYTMLHKVPFLATRREAPAVDHRKPNDNATIESRLSPP